MGRLRNDCFTHDESLLTLAEAEAQLRERLHHVVGTTKIPLAKADGRILAKDVIAPINVPAYDNAAVDGYAVFLADLADDNQRILPVSLRMAAGDNPQQIMPRPSAAHIFTGAGLPHDKHGQSPDAIIMLEDCERQGNNLILQSELPRQGDNIRRCGEDITKGAVILKAGVRLTPAQCGLLASLGITSITVYRRLRVALASSGNELKAGSAPLQAGQIYDANRPMLKAYLARLGAKIDDFGIIADDASQVAAILSQAALNHDLVITSGGMSMGEEDHIQRWLHIHAKHFQFWKLAIKPGRPLGVGLIPKSNKAKGNNECVFIGLPGNVVAAWLTFALLGQLVVRLLSGEKPSSLPLQKVRSGFAMRKTKGRREFVRVVVDNNQHDEAAPKVVKRYPSQGSGVLSSVAGSHGLVILPEELTQVEPNDWLDYLAMKDLLP